MAVEIKLKHDFIKYIPKNAMIDIASCKKFGDFKKILSSDYKYNLLKNTAILDFIDPEGRITGGESTTPENDIMRVFVGELFEIFSEFYFHYHGGNNRYGITNYKNCERRTFGIDAIADSKFEPGEVAIQVKFRSNPNYILTDRHDNISRAFHVAWTQNFSKLIIFTTADKLHYELPISDNVQVINWSEIQEMTNTEDFWFEFSKSLHAAKNK